MNSEQNNSKIDPNTPVQYNNTKSNNINLENVPRPQITHQQNPNPYYPFPCSNCNWRFPNEFKLSAHMSSVHGNQTPLRVMVTAPNSGSLSNGPVQVISKNAFNSRITASPTQGFAKISLQGNSATNPLRVVNPVSASSTPLRVVSQPSLTSGALQNVVSAASNPLRLVNVSNPLNPQNPLRAVNVANPGSLQNIVTATPTPLRVINAPNSGTFQNVVTANPTPLVIGAPNPGTMTNFVQASTAPLRVVNSNTGNFQNFVSASTTPLRVVSAPNTGTLQNVITTTPLRVISAPNHVSLPNVSASTTQLRTMNASNPGSLQNVVTASSNPLRVISNPAQNIAPTSSAPLKVVNPSNGPSLQNMSLPKVDASSLHSRPHKVNPIST